MALLVCWISSSITVDSCPFTDGDAGAWPFSVHILLQLAAFVSTLRWPEELNVMGMLGVSYVEMLILFERWVGHRLLPEKTNACKPPGW